MKEDKKDLNKVELVIGTIFLVALFFSIFLSNKNQDNYEKYKQTFKGETIGFATRIEHRGKADYLRYYFYSDRKILSDISLRGYGRYDFADKFYKVKYDLNNPEENYIVLEEELEPDSISLVKAGFTKTKYYFYDAGVTCKYIEYSKWK